MYKFAKLYTCIATLQSISVVIVMYYALVLCYSNEIIETSYLGKLMPKFYVSTF